MSSADDTRPEHPGGRPVGSRFGGWSDYQEWAERDFRPRDPDDEVGTHPPAALVVEVLTYLSPISLPDLQQAGAESARCQIHPGGVDSESACARDDMIDIHLDIDLEASMIRPYVRTGGRVEAAHPLEFETVLSSTGLHENWSGDTELAGDHLQLCEHCATPQSVAEIAVALNAPIGMVKVLISDAIDQGLLMLHETTPISDGRPPVALLKRVHASLAKLN